MNELLFGIPCIIAQQIKKQKKYSKYKIINWFYKKMYGYEYESTMPEGTDVIYFENKFIFRDKEAFDKMAKAYEETMTYNLFKVREL